MDNQAMHRVAYFQYRAPRIRQSSIEDVATRAIEIFNQREEERVGCADKPANEERLIKKKRRTKWKMERNPRARNTR